MNDKQAVTGKEYGGGGAQNPNIQKEGNNRVLNIIAIVIVALIAVGVLLALLCK